MAGFWASKEVIDYATRQIVRDFLKLSEEQKREIVRLICDIDETAERTVAEIAGSLDGADI